MKRSARLMAKDGTIFAKDYRPGMAVQLRTVFGTFDVDYITPELFAHCPKDNGGFGMSYAINAYTELTVV